MQVQDFATAWRCASINRVDLVTLIAHGWPAFLTTAPLLVAAVPHDQDLVDILTCLQPLDGAGGLLASLSPEQVVWPAPPLSHAPYCLGLRKQRSIVADGMHCSSLLTWQSVVACHHTAAFSVPPPASSSRTLDIAALPHLHTRPRSENTSLPVQVRAGGAHAVAQTCAAMQGALQEAGAGRYLRPLLTCHLVEGQLQEALTLIKQRKEAHIAASTSNSTLGECSGGRRAFQ